MSWLWTLKRGGERGQKGVGHFWLEWLMAAMHTKQNNISQTSYTHGPLCHGGGLSLCHFRGICPFCLLLNYATQLPIIMGFPFSILGWIPQSSYPLSSLPHWAFVNFGAHVWELGKKIFFFSFPTFSSHINLNFLSWRISQSVGPLWCISHKMKKQRTLHFAKEEEKW